MITKIQSMRGGKTHVANPYMLEENDDLFPMCRTGGQDSAGTAYREVSDSMTVDCKTCQRYDK